MSRREELAAVRERDRLMTPEWLPDGLPLWQQTNVADRRLLLGLVDELAAALEFWHPSKARRPDSCDACCLLSDLGPDA